MIQYTNAISQLHSEGYFAGRILSHNGNQASKYADLFVTDDETGTIVTPTEIELSDAQGRFDSAETARQALATTGATNLRAVRDSINNIVTEIEGDIALTSDPVLLRLLERQKVLAVALAVLA